MTGILIVNEFLQTNKFNEIHEWLLNAAKKKDIKLEMKTNAEVLIDISNQSKLPVADFILFWDKDTRLASYLEKSGYPVFNSSKAIEICDDKSLTHLTLMKHDIPMPKTIIAPMTFANIGYTNYNFLNTISDSLGFPMVVKECFGSFGQQVYLARNPEELKEILVKIGAKPVLFQQLIKSSEGRDIRLQVVGGKVIAAMQRFAIDGDFRANITNGGRMESYQPTAEQCRLAIRCCEYIGLDFAGVDLLFGEKDEPILCEVNSNAHFKNIYACTGINAAEAIMEHIDNRLNLQCSEMW